MSGEVLVDALPYIDTGYEEPGVREAALAMVEEETKEYRPTKNYLEHLPPLDLHAFETDILRGEFERMSARHPMDQLPMKRYELPHPPAGKMTDPAAWNECVDNSMAQLQHQFTRIANLDLMMEFSCEAWRSYSTVLTNMLSVAQRRLQTEKKAVQELNWQRKNHQTSAGDKIKKLETDWVSLVSKNFEIELECLKLQRKIEQLKRDGPTEPRRRKALTREDGVPAADRKPKYRRVDEEGSSEESDEESVSRKRKRYEEETDEERQRSPVKRRPYTEESDEEEEYVDKDDLRKYDLAGTVSDEEEEEEEERRRDSLRRDEEREEREETEREREKEREERRDDWKENDVENRREEEEEGDWRKEEEWREERRKREGRWDQREKDASDDSDDGERRRRRSSSSGSSSGSSSESEKEGGGEAMDLENTDSD